VADRLALREPRQQGDLADQIWPVDALIAELSRSVRLAPGT